VLVEVLGVLKLCVGLDQLEQLTLVELVLLLLGVLTLWVDKLVGVLLDGLLLVLWVVAVDGVLTELGVLQLTLLLVLLLASSSCLARM
jgi:hypothetical protein